jgi:hypothetical protein
MDNPVSGSLDNLSGRPVVTLDILHNKFNEVVSGLQDRERIYNDKFKRVGEELQQMYAILKNNDARIRGLETKITSLNGEAIYYKELRERKTPEGIYSGGFKRRSVNKRIKSKKTRKTRKPNKI